MHFKTHTKKKMLQKPYTAHEAYGYFLSGPLHSICQPVHFRALDFGHWLFILLHCQLSHSVSGFSAYPAHHSAIHWNLNLCFLHICFVLWQLVKQWLVPGVYEKWMGIEMENWKTMSSNIEDRHYCVLAVEYLLASPRAPLFFGTIVWEQLLV